MNLTGQAIHQKSPKPIRDKAHLNRVRDLPCVICQSWPSDDHHCIHDRHGQARECDHKTIPLCPDCHRELHADKKAWREKHGPDHGFLEQVWAALNAQGSATIGGRQ